MFYFHCCHKLFNPKKKQQPKKYSNFCHNEVVLFQCHRSQNEAIHRFCGDGNELESRGYLTNINYFQRKEKANANQIRGSFCVSKNDSSMRVFFFLNAIECHLQTIF